MDAREIARGVLTRPDGFVLLFPLEDGRLALPGGRVEPGETHEQTLARELREELGLPEARVGPLLWSREHVYHRNRRPMLFRERHFLVEVDADCPTGRGSFYDVPEDGGEHSYAPPQLPLLLAQLRVNGPPAVPPHITG